MDKKGKQDQQIATKPESMVTSGDRSTARKKPYVPPVLLHQPHIRDITFGSPVGLMGPIQGSDDEKSRGGSGEVWDNIFDD